MRTLSNNELAFAIRMNMQQSENKYIFKIISYLTNNSGEA